MHDILHGVIHLASDRLIVPVVECVPVGTQRQCRGDFAHDLARVPTELKDLGLVVSKRCKYCKGTQGRCPYFDCRDSRSSLIIGPSGDNRNNFRLRQSSIWAAFFTFGIGDLLYRFNDGTAPCLPYFTHMRQIKQSALG